MKETYAQFMARAAKRRQLAARLRDQGKTYVEIAQQLGCTRQRAEQLAKQGQAERAAK